MSSTPHQPAPAGDTAATEPSATEPSATEPNAAEPSAAAVPDCAPQLKQMFPALFAGAPKPVKLRIQDDIQARAPGVFTKRALTAFFRRHTLSTGYLIALTRAATRFDLDGAPAGEISQEHREAARAELARRRARQDEKRETELAQRRERATLLRDFEGTRLTTANFCALKAIAPETLDGLLAQARAERAEAPPPAPEARPGRHRPDPAAHRPQGRPQERPQGRPKDQAQRGPRDRQGRPQGRPAGGKPPAGPKPSRG